MKRYNNDTKLTKPNKRDRIETKFNNYFRPTVDTRNSEFVI